MARRKKGGSEGPNKDSWLNTYADMITLILVFFVLLFSMSSLDAEKYKLLVEMFNPTEKLENTGSVTDPPPDGATSPVEDITVEEVVDLEDLYQYLSEYVEKNNLESQIDISKGENMVGVQFMSAMFFQPDRANLTPEGSKLMGDIGVAISQVQDTIQAIRVDGHTAVADSPVDDRDLSTDRANAVLRYLEGTFIRDPAKLLAVGYGQYHPVAPNDTEENRAKNRRVEIIISQEEDLVKDFESITEASENEETQE